MTRSWMIQAVKVVGVRLRSVGEDGSCHGVHGAVVEAEPGERHKPQLGASVVEVEQLLWRVVDDDSGAEGQGQAEQQQQAKHLQHPTNTRRYTSIKFSKSNIFSKFLVTGTES